MSHRGGGAHGGGGGLGGGDGGLGSGGVQTKLAPDPEEYPELHVQVEEPAELEELGGHDWHVAAPASLNCPGLHVAQETCPAFDWY